MNVWWQQLVLVMLGGALGAAGRFWLGGALLRQFGSGMQMLVVQLPNYETVAEKPVAAGCRLTERTFLRRHDPDQVRRSGTALPALSPAHRTPVSPDQS